MIVPKDKPERCPGVYTLDLYCRYENPAHDWGEFPVGVVEFQTYQESVRFARGLGWIMHRDQTATCPKCASVLNVRAGKSSPAVIDSANSRDDQ